MKKSIHRAICFLFAVLVVCSLFPVSAFAVDPVSAGVMANAFAQAIAAYGATNGVAMTFDVTSTSSIGESVHELWSQFRAGTQDADDYATLAAALFPELYYKAAAAIGTASDVYTVGYNISSEYAEEFDNFYNWLLSGPAEMVKVDNEYYQFSQSQIGVNAQPLDVFSSSRFPNQPLAYASDSSQATILSVGSPIYSNGTYTRYAASRATNMNIYCFSVGTSLYFINNKPNEQYTVVYTANINGDSYHTPASFGSTTVNGSVYYVKYINNVLTDGWYNVVPSYSNVSDGYAAALEFDSDPSGESVGVKAYDSSGVASFPDTSDPNYEAVAKRIPSDIPWNDSAYGDGTGTLTDAQSGAIAAEADSVIADDGVLTLADEATVDPGPGGDDPSNDPDDYLAVGLEDIFPFCIPFDIYNFLSALAADPVAPHFTATLQFPQAVGGSQTIDLDFDSPTWNQLAQLLRLLELLAFIVGLALLTRSMFIRG